MYCITCQREWDIEQNIGISYSICFLCLDHKIIGGKKENVIKF